MQKIYINMPSITFAMKSEKLLGRNNIYGLVVKTPSKFSGCGCGYSLIIDLKDLDSAKQILQKYNIVINDIRNSYEV